MEHYDLNKETDQDFFNFIDDTPPAIKKQIIQNGIIPLMNLRRHKVLDLTSEQIAERLNRPGSSGKAGEKVELWYELLARNSSVIDSEMACELADIAYYGLQPNAKSENSLEALYQSELIEFVGIPLDALLTFCILKYSTRLGQGDKPDYKQKEFDTISRYLELHPEIKNLWMTTN
jgi:hypothetical protein